ncbi:MAG: hypothetical protein A3G33_06265 [Omnitrophica bacterium RIFCSPLOWO2_12_FULL_44_17]|uniref:Excinuclease ABC subunit C n=1 Tax=Candidatus Danuiimicrobium aquiferis TaxID=1801832 RepID=A0A1G1KVB1_9BACT|nr:MAG: hypothetical protein A3B72_04810 [Omnitrophica bacterium RIFCSPHIGHO2_02_FULL_45_28]OGW88708.1 MAG: hypothetical protein A3E74_09590 [Omnitrophica bacterium RIFCSPHIGHO2_12_FULL_44_12]OGW96888.1 MAG: hypothetical protein A3G33_06265 [Omnitrophica bacterium RIFCSPLOWO2_12_FULL_44_17]OGX02421.1 MAG: hypothetical protein A3J12_05010 [Omnitrophica bacterium RIFCSPLOWO2_02_FULL_44_11]
MSNKGSKSKSGLTRLAVRVSKLPGMPGVYLFKEKTGRILYIGKARDLKKRVSSYFHARNHSPKVSVLIGKIADVEIIETQTEMDALLLEAHLIHRYAPRYNTLLKDDKTYPLLKITGDAYPRLLVTRNRTERKATYYGPYTDSGLLQEAVRIINSLFPIRKCQTLPKRACLYYHIGQCLAPCIKPEVKREYDRLIREVKAFLQGGRKSLMDYLTDRMISAANEFRFEDAQFFKSQIEALGWFRKKRFDIQKPEHGIGLRGTLELRKILKMERLPEKIVCFDVSNIHGDQAVASKVCFYRELANTMEYRRYKIKSVSGIDDYAMISEALGRMIKGILEGSESRFPDLIVIDGGRGHLNAAKKVLEAMNVPGIELLSIAKKFEWVFSPKFEYPIIFPRDSSVLRLLQKIRDEAHRFAITYHRALRGKVLSRSVLDEIPGVGEKRKKILLSSFESLRKLRDTPLAILEKMDGINCEIAQTVIDFLKVKYPDE